MEGLREFPDNVIVFKIEKIYHASLRTWSVKINAAIQFVLRKGVD